jgi:hypothetical protein
MAFYRFDPAMALCLESVLDELDAEGRPGLRNSLGLTWIRYSMRIQMREMDWGCLGIIRSPSIPPAW